MFLAWQYTLTPDRVRRRALFRDFMMAALCHKDPYFGNTDFTFTAKAYFPFFKTASVWWRRKGAKQAPTNRRLP
jgi:hypothetical protein